MTDIFYDLLRVLRRRGAMSVRSLSLADKRRLEDIARDLEDIIRRQRPE